jgi:tRNA threonylcarbamoyl adenosine modification protein YeaZ/ribosomal-protein-alanine acetyltransferase
LNILALDTTTRAGSLAVARDGSLLSEYAGDSAITHGQRLPSDIRQALEAAGTRVDDLDLLAVAAGPGSFTGLRVGIAAVQGLAVARGLKVVPVPTLEALALAATAHAGAEDHVVAAWMDGQRGEVFGAWYEAGGGQTVTEIQRPVAGKPGTILGAWALPVDRPVLFIGDGAIKYRDLLVETFGPRARIVSPPPLAATIARLAFEQPHRAVFPHEIVPVYVRRSDAELARERQATVEARDHVPSERSSTPFEGHSRTIERVTSPEDLDAVATLEAACFTNPWTREMLEREVRESDVARVYVLRDPGGPVLAFCSCWVIQDELHINTIAVDPIRRRGGLATSLMRQVMAEAVRSGATRATLEVRASNEPARRLYAALGFSERGVRPRYYSQPDEDAIILWRESLG